MAVTGTLSAQNTLAISPDGKWVAYVVNDTLRVAASTRSRTSSVVAEVKTYYAVPRWSPRSDELAYYSARSGSTQLWVYNVRTKAHKQLTLIEGGIAPDPRSRFAGWTGDPLIHAWRPDGTSIAFAHQVSLPDQASKVLGTGERLGAQSPESLARGQPLVLSLTSPPDWTLEGVLRQRTRYVFRKGQKVLADDGASDAGPTQLFLVDVEGRQVQQLTSDTAGYFTPDWSPDGKRLAYMSPEGRSLLGFGADESNIYVRDVVTSQVGRLTVGRMRKTLPRWSPDGRMIAYLGAAGPGGRGGQGVYVVRSDQSAPARYVTAAVDRYVYWYAWSPDGSSILVVYRDGLASPLAAVDVRTGAISRISPSDAVVQALAASAGGIAWVQSVDPNAATALWTAGWPNPTPRHVADLMQAADPHTARRQEALRWRNSRGDQIDGIVSYPVGYVPGRPLPTVVDTYGSDVNTRLTDQYNLLKASPRYVVFHPNHRAPHMWMNPTKSASYDSAAAGPNGIGVMTDDILSGVDTLVRRGISDPERLCVFGFSSGGLEAEQLLTQTDRFKCAVLQSPAVSDWSLLFFLSTDDPEVVRWMYGIAPWEDPALYTALIPPYHADMITTPVLLAVGDRENLLLLSTIEMYNALRYLKRDVTLLRYPDQGHGFTGSAAEDFETRMKKFFDDHLQR